MARKKIAFMDIVTMIATDSIPVGAKFYTPVIAGEDEMLEVTLDHDGCLVWVDESLEYKTVPMQQAVITDDWYMDTPDIEMTLDEAIAALKDGRDVMVSVDNNSFQLSAFISLNDLWTESPVKSLDDLLNKATFYQVVVK